MRPHMRMLALASVMATLGLGAWAAPALADPPANDDFSDAAVLDGLPADATGSNVDATKEAGEPDHAGNPGGHSVWWEWTAQADGDVEIDTCGSGFDTLLAVYTGGAPDSLTEVASNDDGSACELASKVVFSATAGQTYRIAVDGWGDAEFQSVGEIVLSIDTAPPPAKTYLALGDSVSAGYGAPPGRGFVDRYFAYLADPGHGGAEALVNLARPGENSASMREGGGQLDQALATINGRSDIVAVTVDIGGNDGSQGLCPVGYNQSPCEFSGNYAAIVGQLADALANDPGAETFQALEYYNPASGTQSTNEGIYQYALLGSDARVDCAGAGNQLGLNDLVRCIGRDRGVASVDAYGTFKAVGQALMADNVHPNEGGHVYLACLFEHPDRAGSTNPCEPSTTPPPQPRPDTDAPVMRLSAPSRQHLRRRGVSLTIRTNEDADVTVSGVISGIPRAARVVRLRAVKKHVTANTPTRFTLRVTRKGFAAVRRALRGRRPVRLRLAVAATDAAGNTGKKTMRIRLVR